MSLTLLKALLLKSLKSKTLSLKPYPPSVQTSKRLLMKVQRYSIILAVSYKKLLAKGDAMLSVITSAPQKAVLVQESADIIEDFVDQVQEVKQLENYLTFDPICGISLYQKRMIDLSDKLERLKKCEIGNLKQASQMSKLNQEVTELLKKYSALVFQLRGKPKMQVNGINKKCILYDYMLNILEKQPEKNTKEIAFLVQRQ
eukprot:TRINITY_DN66547_c0_g1_i1.p1 TRINITY_DN66547_c0_g1~~TRINITY_DN66547_c0_g1_i1.p1  ORF type:complete len:201 (-),score=17.99 TRINITY_DN66547_c0_g1_i1:46-648(-)